MNRLSSLAASVLLAGALAACSTANTSKASTPAASSPSTSASSAAPSPSASSAKESAAVITIKDFAFAVPGPLSPGQKIAVRNDDSEAHTVTADSGGAFDVKIAPGSTVMLTAPSTSGSYKFHCSFHSNMHGALRVM